ncbi:ribosome-associated protein [uncultured Gammaproteobacteria bacterium]
MGRGLVCFVPVCFVEEDLIITAVLSSLKTPPLTPDVIKSLVDRSLEDDQADLVVVINLAGLTTFADYMVIASGRSTRHVGSMAQNLVERLKVAGMPGVEIEGMPQCDWVLVDAGDVIVHLFRPEVRSFYNLEKLWGAELPEPLLPESQLTEPLLAPLL